MATIAKPWQQTNMSVQLGKMIAERELIYRPNKRKHIIVRLGVPREEEPMVWMCPFQIAGVDRSRIDRALGLDAIQALVLALEKIRIQLARHAIGATWKGGEKGDPGFPVIVTTALGREFASRMSRIIA